MIIRNLSVFMIFSMWSKDRQVGLRPPRDDRVMKDADEDIGWIQIIQADFDMLA